MLCELYIENLAVIEKAGISLREGLNVFTGETGAGKSIVIDAINAILGHRVSREVVRHGAAKARITASFRELPPRAVAKLAEYGYEPEEGEITIMREIFADAKSSARISGRPVTVGILREIGTELINIHGQHDNQVLLAPERHMEILDRYGDLSVPLEEYTDCYRNVVRIKREMKKAAQNEQGKAERIDLLTYQVNEIRTAELRPGEDEALEAKRTEYRSASRILGFLRQAQAALDGDSGEGGSLDLTRQAIQSLERAADVCENAGELYSKLDGVGAELESLSEGIAELMESLHFSPTELERLENRLDELNQLKRKYGGNIEAVLKYGEAAQEELSSLELSGQRIQELNQAGQREYQRLLRLAEEITALRRQAAERLTASVTKELAFLDMPNVRLEVSMQQGKPNPRGRDAVEFLISTNRGEPPKPVAKIASGGELSRIMLAIKNTLADRDEIPTLIFDEVDTGVSGRAAQKIGLKLQQAAEHRQILVVTHLAQIAALADAHYLIQKESNEERTFTEVLPLDLEGRTAEVARIMGTDQITSLTLKNAAEMIQNGRRKNQPERRDLG